MTVTSSDLVRFWSKVDKQPGEDACWLWTASTSRGYGKFYIFGKNRQAQRVSWYFQYGAWPEEFALHHCDVRNCVCPNHLFNGSSQVNALDREVKGRGNHLGLAKGVLVPQSVLSEVDVLEIRQRVGKQTQTSLAIEFGVSMATISRVVNRQAWKHV